MLLSELSFLGPTASLFSGRMRSPTSSQTVALEDWKFMDAGVVLSSIQTDHKELALHCDPNP